MKNKYLIWVSKAVRDERDMNLKLLESLGDEKRLHFILARPRVVEISQRGVPIGHADLHIQITD